MMVKRNKTNCAHGGFRNSIHMKLCAPFSLVYLSSTLSLAMEQEDNNPTQIMVKSIFHFVETPCHTKNKNSSSLNALSPTLVPVLADKKYPFNNQNTSKNTINNKNLKSRKSTPVVSSTKKDFTPQRGKPARFSYSYLFPDSVSILSNQNSILPDKKN